MVLLIDNYDSFSYNLYQYVGELESEVKVIRNDEMTVEEILAMNPDHIIVSPGPGRPKDAGICEDLIKANTNIPLLGVCLGHQAICETFGGTVTYAKQLMHGKQSEMEIDKSKNCPIFTGMDSKRLVGRYHSLAAAEETLPSELVVTAKTADDEVMAVMHVSRPIYGVQFHPESILTPNGIQMLKNFLRVKKANQTI